MPPRNRTLLCAMLLALPALLQAQGTLADYRRAATINQKYQGLTVGLIQGGVNWIPGTNRLWYQVNATGGNQFVLVDADTWTRQPAFDHGRLAQGLSAVAGAQFTERTLAISTLSYAATGDAIEFDGNESRWRCTLADYACTRIGNAVGGRPGGLGPGGPGGQGQGGGQFGGNRPDTTSQILSPDGRTAACVKNFNIAIRPVSSTAPSPTAGGPGGGRGGAGGPGGAAALRCPDDANTRILSTDGSEGDAYQFRSIVWSPDSKKLVVYRQRPGYNRQVHFVRSSPTDQVQPRHETTATLSANGAGSYAKPGDVLAFNQPIIFDVSNGQRIAIDDALFPKAYQISRPVWRKDSRAYTFEYNERGHMNYRVLEVNGTNGAVRTVVDEATRSFFAYRPAAQSGLSDTGKNFRFDVDDGREIVWMSERDGWNHLYLYDGATGRVKNQITKGPWVVKSVDSVDVAKRQIYFAALGMNKDQDPYFIHYYRINFDGTGLVAFTQGNGTHTISWSPDRQYYVDSWSRVDLPPIVELKRASDQRVLPLEKGDMSAALATGWKPPQVFVAKARDGVTDIWGVVVQPFSFDPNRKYPVIESIYAGPQGSFVPKAWGGAQNFLALAEIGFVVVQIDGMGTNNRSKAFHDMAWKNLADAGFPDRKLWHKAYAARNPWYDISRVGIYGGSAGGQNAAGAVFLHGDFYDAAWSSSGCHDNRMDKIWWNEHWMGEMGAHYEANSNVTHAHKLVGKLFLAVGELDTNVDPASTLQVADALIRAGKDFELLVVPNGGHGATGRDGPRKQRDFFVKSLYGVLPPDWNAGATIEVVGANGLDFPELETPPYGFFDDPTLDLPPFLWW